MRNVPNVKAERCRVAGESAMGNNGHFLLDGPEGNALFCVVSDGAGWDHVSVSVRSRIIGATAPPRLPTWAEMDHVKRLFFRDDEVAVQIHPTAAAKIDNAEVLHLWRSQDAVHPLPPVGMVGVREPEGGDGETVVTLTLGPAESAVIEALARAKGVGPDEAFGEVVSGVLRAMWQRFGSKPEAANDPV